MESFCHQLSKPAGCRLHARKADQYISLVLVLMNKGQCFFFDINTRTWPKVCDLLKPCGNVTAFVRGCKVSIQVDNDEVLSDVRMDPVSPFDALKELLDASCQQSTALAEYLSKKRELRDVSDEACELFIRIEKIRKEEFAKFALLLNEKKRKIRKLEELSGLPATEQVIDDDYGLTADVQKLSQETARSGDSPQDFDETLPRLNERSKRLRLEYTSERTDDGEGIVENTHAATSSGAMKTRDSHEDTDDRESDTADNEGLLNSDEAQSVEERQSDSEDSRALDYDNGRADEPESGKKLVEEKVALRDGDGEIDEAEDERNFGGQVATRDAEATEASRTTQGALPSPKAVAEQRHDEALDVSRDQAGVDEEASMRKRGYTSPQRTEAARTTKKKTSSLDMLDDLL